MSEPNYEALPGFINRIKSLWNIDRHRVPELSDEQWVEFRDNAVKYFTRTDDAQQRAIWREVERRQRS